MKERIVLLMFLLLVMLACLPDTVRFLGGMAYEIALATLAALTGLAVNFLAVRLGLGEHLDRATTLDDFVGKLLVKRSALRTFLGLYLWNILASALVVTSGFLTMGIFPIIWVLLNLGLFCPEITIFKRYLYCWFEAPAFILSSSLGIWGGVKLNILLENLGLIPPTFIILILVLYAFSAFLETLEISGSRRFLDSTSLS